MTGPEWLIVSSLAMLEVIRWPPHLPMTDRVARPVFRVMLVVGWASVVWKHLCT